MRLTAQDYRRDAVAMAKALLGMTLCRRLDDGSVLRARIVETEAYFGEEDTSPCGHCDTCIDKRKRTDHTPQDVQQGILYMAQLKPRTLSDFVKTLSFPQDEIINMVAMLVDEGYLNHLDDDTYHNPEPLK